MTITCQVCGTINPDGTTYCEGCGVELATAPAAPAAPIAETTPVEASPASDTTATPDATTAAPTPVDPVPSESIPIPADTTSPAPEAAVAPDSAATGEPAPVAQVPAAAPAVDATAPDAGMAAVPVAPVAGPAAPTDGAAKLGIKKFGAPTGEFIPLQGERLTVGRFDASTGPVDIDLTGMSGQEHISRRHAELYLDGGAWHVRDLGSTNGVYLKRRGEAAFSPRLQEPAALADGDEIAFGNVMLTFQQA